MRSQRPQLALALGSVLALGLAIVLASILVKWNVPLPRCAFRAVSGMPCFTCGSTRALVALAQFDVWTAFRLNPLITLACAAVPCWLGVTLFNVMTGSRFGWRRTPKPKVLLGLLALAVIVNWGYLLRTLPR